MSLFAGVAMLAASLAGRVGEDGSGALWIAPELVAPASAEQCSQVPRPRETGIVFEVIGDEPDDTALATLAGNAVFEWNPGTGELAFTGVTPAPAFAGMEPAGFSYSSASARSCGSD